MQPEKMKLYCAPVVLAILGFGANIDKFTPRPESQSRNINPAIARATTRCQIDVTTKYLNIRTEKAKADMAALQRAVGNGTAMAALSVNEEDDRNLDAMECQEQSQCLAALDANGIVEQTRLSCLKEKEEARVKSVNGA